MRVWTSILVVILFFIGSSCRSPKAFIYRDVKNFRVGNLGLTKSRVSMDLLFFNPNNFGVKLKNVNCDLYIDSNYVGKLVLDTLMYIPKSSEFSLPANFDVNMKNLFKNSINLIFNNEVLIGARGTTRVGKGMFYVTIPFKYEGKQKLNLLQ